MEELVNKLIKQNAELMEQNADQQRQNDDQSKQFMEQQAEHSRQQAEQSKIQAEQAKVLAELLAKQAVPAVPAAGGGGLPAVPAPARKTPEEILRDKISLLHQLLTKSPKVKDYKTTNDQPIKEWLIDFEETLNSIAKLSCNLDLEAEPLSRGDYVDILRDKLGSQAKKEINRAFEARNPVLKWSTITQVQLKEVLLTQFGDKKPDISAVFKAFGSDCYKKPGDMNVRKFYALWREQLDPCMQPSTEEEHKAFTDLIQRCIFYRALDDEFLQKELCNLVGPDINLQRFYNEAIIAEGKRADYKSNAKISNTLCTEENISVNKYEYNSSVNNSKRPAKKSWHTPAAAAAGGQSDVTSAHSTVPAAHAPPSYSGRPNQENYHPQQGYRKQKRQGGGPKKVLTCYTCGIVGHMSTDCSQNYQNSQNSKYVNPRNGNNGAVHKTSVDPEDDDTMHINGFKAMQINSFKAEIVCTSSASYRRKSRKLKISPSGRFYNGNIAKVDSNGRASHTSPAVKI